MPKGLAVGVVSNGRPVDLRWAASLTSLTANSSPLGMNTGWMFNDDDSVAGRRPRRSIGLKRDEIAEKAIEHGYEYLQFIDDDTVCPPYTFRALHYQLANNPDVAVCGGIYCTREENPQPLVFMEIGGGSFYEWKLGDIFPCAALGCGAMMIKTKVFKDVPKPWFKEVDECPGPQIVSEKMTEDFYFCKKVAEAGYKVLAHGGVLAGHIGQNRRVYTLPPDSYPLKGMKVEEITVQLS